MKASASRHRNRRLVIVDVPAATLLEVPVEPRLAKRIQAATERRQAAEVEHERLIVEAVSAGGSLREVAALAGLSHVAVLKIVKRAK